MVLVDLIDLRLKKERPGSVGDGGGGGGFDGEDDDAEDDDDDELDGPDFGQKRLRRIVIHPCAEQPGSFWAVHDLGAWAVSVRWLSTVARQLAAAAAAEAEGFGGLDDAVVAYGDGGRHGDDEAESAPRGRFGGGSLPAPVLRELLLSEEGIASSATVGSVLAGSSCVFLERSGQVSLARPGAPAGDLAVAADDGEDDMADVLGGKADGAVASAEAQVAVQELYAELLAGPRSLPEPAAPAGGCDVRTPAGKEHLAAQLAWLQGKYVRYVAMAHSDAINRARQVQAEVRDQMTVATEVQSLSDAVADKQDELAERVGKLQARHANLLERLKVLALLHWGAPRPLSRAEKEFSRQLEMWEQQQHEAALAWGALKQRIDAMLSARQEDQQQQRQTAAGLGPSPSHPVRGHTPGSAPRVLSAAAAIPLPQQQSGGPRRLSGAQSSAASRHGALSDDQLNKLYSALASQKESIAAGRQRLDMLKEDLAAFLSNNPEAQLPPALLSMSATLSSLR